MLPVFDDEVCVRAVSRGGRRPTHQHLSLSLPVNLDTARDLITRRARARGSMIPNPREEFAKTSGD